MPKKPIIRTSEYPYHIYARSNNRENFFIPTSNVWEIMVSEIRTVTNRYHAQIHAFILMLNHFHMLISTPKENIDAIMKYLMREVSRKIARSAKRINRIFGGRYRRSLIKNNAYYAHVYRYIYRNPVEVKMSNKVEEYPFSTMQMLIKNQTSKPFPLFDKEYISRSEIIPKNLNERLDWLNVPYASEQGEMIRKALRRNIFRLSTQNSLIKTRKSLETF